MTIGWLDSSWHSSYIQKSTNNQMDPLVPHSSPVPLLWHSERNMASLPRAPLKRRRSLNPDDELKPTVPRKKLKLTANGKQPRPFTSKQRLLRLLHRQKVMSKKMMTVPLGKDRLRFFNFAELVIQERLWAAKSLRKSLLLLRQKSPSPLLICVSQLENKKLLLCSRV